MKAQSALLLILAAFAEGLHLLGGLLQFIQLLQDGFLFFQRLGIRSFHFVEQFDDARQ